MPTIKRKDLIIFGIIAVPATIMTINSHSPNFWHIASNFTFGMGFIYIMVGLSVIVRNLGLFKTLSYNKYRRDFRKHGNADSSARPASFGEFVTDTTGNRPYKGYLIFGAALLALSYAFVVAA